MSLKLFAFNAPFNGRLHKIRIAATFAGQKFDIIPSSEIDNQLEAYTLNCAPTAKHPCLQTEQGYIFESTAILRYFGRVGKNAGIYGSTDFEASQIDSWIDWTSTELEPFFPFLGAALGFAPPLEEAVAKKQSDAIMTALEGLDRWLEIRTYVVGERPTIADFNLFISIDAVLRLTPTAADVAAKCKNVVRYHLTILHHPKVQEALKAGGHDGLIPAKPKKEEPKKEEKKKEEKPAKKEEAAPAHDEDEGEDFPQEKKKPNPLDALPPSPFVLDAFKREYSNTDTRKVAAPYFFDKFDNEGYTAWWCNYKYNDENKLPFMTSNLIRGWFQRMDHVRKYGFGIALIVGEETKHEITAFWIFRGKSLPEIVLEVDDTELFTWTEIPDLKAETAKITDYLCWDGATFAAKPVLEGRAFK